MLDPHAALACRTRDIYIFENKIHLLIYTSREYSMPEYGVQFRVSVERDAPHHRLVPKSRQLYTTIVMLQRYVGICSRTEVKYSIWRSCLFFLVARCRCQPGWHFDMHSSNNNFVTLTILSECNRSTLSGNCYFKEEEEEREEQVRSEKWEEKKIYLILATSVGVAEGGMCSCCISSHVKVMQAHVQCASPQQLKWFWIKEKKYFLISVCDKRKGQAIHKNRWTWKFKLWCVIVCARESFVFVVIYIFNVSSSRCVFGYRFKFISSFGHYFDDFIIAHQCIAIVIFAYKKMICKATALSSALIVRWLTCSNTRTHQPLCECERARICIHRLRRIQARARVYLITYICWAND